MREKLKLKKQGEARVRFAPSPTGFLHIGGARTALFNYIFSKQQKGIFILRIEDTDIERSKPEFEKDIIDGLNWLGIEYDEKIYRQSERTEIYKKYLEKLLEKNKAYYCFCAPEDLEAERQEQMSRGVAPRYNGKCSNLSKEEIAENLKQGKKFVIRLRNANKKIKFLDLIRGEVEFDSSLIGDFVIAKNFEIPLFYLAGVIDDFEMKITHIIRGEDHISNTPKQILIQEALGFSMPIYAHLPLILAPDKSKLSKRHGATSLIDYKNQGYLAEAIINFLIFLGWHPAEGEARQGRPGTDKEIYSLEQLIKDFSIEKIQKSGAVFNIQKLDYLNGFYIRQKSTEELAELCLPFLVEQGLITPVFVSEQYPPAYGGQLILENYKITETGEIIKFSSLKKIISVCQERLKKLSEITSLSDYFFKQDLEYDKNLLIWRKSDEPATKEALNQLIENLSLIKEKDWNSKNLENILMPLAEGFKIGDKGSLLWPLRVALSGKEASAGPFEIADVLGKEKTIRKLEKASKLISR